jgi:predicted aspartyl protease
MVEIPLQIIDLQDDGFHPLVEVVVFGKPHTVVLDTGASRTVFDKSILLEANNEIALTDTDKLSTGLGTNSMSSSKLVLHDLHIGSLHIPNFEVAVLDLSHINNAYSQLNLPLILGVLGGDVLMKYKAVIDYGKSTLLLNS